MAVDDFEGEPVRSGVWLYDGAVWRAATVVACNFDRAHAEAMDDAAHAAPGEEIDVPPARPLGPDGLLYHVSGTSCPPFETASDATAWADGQPWGPVRWSE